jgi:hypothetical protein
MITRRAPTAVDYGSRAPWPWRHRNELRLPQPATVTGESRAPSPRPASPLDSCFRSSSSSVPPTAQEESRAADGAPCDARGTAIAHSGGPLPHSCHGVRGSSCRTFRMAVESARHCGWRLPRRRALPSVPHATRDSDESQRCAERDLPRFRAEHASSLFAQALRHNVAGSHVCEGFWQIRSDMPCTIRRARLGTGCFVRTVPRPLRNRTAGSVLRSSCSHTTRLICRKDRAHVASLVGLSLSEAEARWWEEQQQRRSV